MTVERELMAGRREAEKLMVTQCKITRAGAGGEPVLDEETGDYIYPPSPTVYEGPCKIRRVGLSVRDVDAVGQLLTVQESILSLPIAGTDDVQVDDKLIVLSNPLDLALVGKQFRVKGTQEQTYATARRFAIERTS